MVMDLTICFKVCTYHFSWIKIFNEPTFYKIIKNLEKTEITNYFINNISYRVKRVNLIDYIKPSYKKSRGLFV